LASTPETAATPCDPMRAGAASLKLSRCWQRLSAIGDRF
jgi:hypothetical protein